MNIAAIQTDFESAKVPFLRKGSFSKQLKENPTGAGYFGMNIAWMLAGMLTTGIDVAAGFANFVGSSSRLKINPEYTFLGKKNWDRRLGSGAGAVSTYISTAPKAIASLAIGDYVTFASIFLNDALITGAQIVDFKSGELQGLDRSKYSWPVAKLLENPSYYAGLGRAASRLLPIGLSLASGNIPVALAFVGLGLVDLYYTRTKAVTGYKKAAAQVTHPSAALTTTSVPIVKRPAPRISINRPVRHKPILYKPRMMAYAKYAKMNTRKLGKYYPSMVSHGTRGRLSLTFN